MNMNLRSQPWKKEKKKIEKTFLYTINNWSELIHESIHVRIEVSYSVAFHALNTDC